MHPEAEDEAVTVEAASFEAEEKARAVDEAAEAEATTVETAPLDAEEEANEKAVVAATAVEAAPIEASTFPSPPEESVETHTHTHNRAAKKVRIWDRLKEVAAAKKKQ